MDDIIKNIDKIFEQLKVCAYGRTLPSGNDSVCNPFHFARQTEQLFCEIEKINELSPNFWKGNEYNAVYDCERLSKHDLSIAALKSCKNSEDIILNYLNQIREIVDIIHFNYENNYV